MLLDLGTLSGKRRLVGRPKIDASVEQIILAIKAQNPRYGAERISAMVSEQLGVKVSESTLRNVLKRNLSKPTPSTGRRAARSSCSFASVKRKLTGR